MGETLAILGGKPVRDKPFPWHPIITDAEKRAVMEVLDSGKLSGFLGVPGDLFLGGTKVRQLERCFCEYHGVEFAVAFNSATSALHAAVAAAGVQGGEEVIVTPYTFSSSASCVLMHNAVPVFADVEDTTYGLDPEAVERAITPRTRAIIVVHLFGHPARIEKLRDVARRHGLRLIEDCAQSPGARHKGQCVGTFGDCGIFSLTENKNITCGEGGMLITNDEGVAKTARLVRNHGEAIPQDAGLHASDKSVLGWNYRLTETDAALGIVQFGKLDQLNQGRIDLAGYLSRKLAGVDGLTPPTVADGARHVFYIYAMKYDAGKIGLPRNLFVKALAAEGITIGAGYVAPLYWQSIYQNRDAYVYRHYDGDARYDRGLCPTVERLHLQDLIVTGVLRPPTTEADVDDIVEAVGKVLAHRQELLKRQPA